jgi:dTDP-4-dehydrorhamnose 3,5-epimerase
MMPLGWVENSRFTLIDQPLSGLRLLQRNPIGDSRGYLERLFCIEDLDFLLPSNKKIVQINHTYTAERGTARGMHFQITPYMEQKFVHCIRGEVFDVAVDVRRNSPTFLCWHAEILSESNYRTFVIPEGFAHGFQALTDQCEMLYFHTAAYRQDAECGLHIQDPSIGIQWPLPIKQVSKRDLGYPMLSTEFQGVSL